jgi:hypothetical protein
MKMRRSTKNTIHGALLLSMLLMMTACGDGGGKEKKGGGNSCANPLLFIFCVILSGTSAPEQGQDYGTSSMVSAAAGGKAENLDQASEYEPNNILDNANVVTFPAGSTDESTGLRLSGAVQASSDIADYFVFTPTHSGAHLIYLCANTCDESLEDDSAYIMIYDQNQTTIASTPVGTISKQEFAVDLTAGFAYYVEVNGYAAVDRYDYRLAIVD